MNECAERGCPGEVDRDGYCLMFGHACARVGSVASVLARAPDAAGVPSGRPPAQPVQSAPTGPAAPTGPTTPAAPSGSTTPAAPSGPTAPAVSSPGAGPAGAPAPLPALSRADSASPLWAGLVDMPGVALADPAATVLAHPSVPEARRFCSRCQLAVGRSRDGQPGRTEGFCPRDRTPFSFSPKLAPGDRINQFEVLGCLAHGGVGWIYLARDLNLDGSWRVLKGLRDAGDAGAWEAVVAERRFLAQVDHPNIVKIYDFVQHQDPVTGAVAGYLVMEYVGGRSLHDMLADRRRPDGGLEPIPLAQVLAYGAEILTALDYLHGRGLLYCDLKPDNVIHGPDRLKLIDLGAVRHQGDPTGLVWGARGFQAREVPVTGPSVRSDLYAVGRTMAVLSLGVPGMSTRYADRLPDPTDAPLLAQHESYHRLLRRATDPDPQRRFATAREMREQLTGVLREVLSAADGRPRPAPSTLFGPQQRSFGTNGDSQPPAAGGQDNGEAPTGLDPAAVAEALPVPLVDLSDPAASFLATLGYPDPDEVIAALTDTGMSTVEVRLRLVRAYIDSANRPAAAAELERLLAEQPDDWRVSWYQGVAQLGAGRAEAAYRAFDLVYASLPGELDAKLAVAVSAELAGDIATAALQYERVWLTNRDFVSAAFGCARLRLAAGDWAGAVAMLDSVPQTSSQYLAAQMAALRSRLRGPSPAELTEPELVAAGTRITRLNLDLERRTRARIEVLQAALAWVVARRMPSPALVLRCPLNERELRFGLEREYRALAELSPRGSARRIQLVDRANAVRPRTLT